MFNHFWPYISIPLCTKTTRSMSSDNLPCPHPLAAAWTGSWNSNPYHFRLDARVTSDGRVTGITDARRLLRAPRRYRGRRDAKADGGAKYAARRRPSVGTWRQSMAGHWNNPGKYRPIGAFCFDSQKYESTTRMVIRVGFRDTFRRFTETDGYKADKSPVAFLFYPKHIE